MKIYKDLERREEVDVLNLGRLPAGETKKYTFYVYNDTAAILEALTFTVSHDEVVVVKAPEEMVVRGMDELTVEWSPSVTLKEGLQTRITITGKEIWS